MNNGPFVVRHITFNVTKLLDHNNQFHNQINTSEAQIMARNAGLDLVCFNYPKEKELAFCKILDFNKWKYEEEKKKKKEALANRRYSKEMQFTPNIAENDIEHKMRQVNEFLDKGDDVTLLMKLRGREKAHFNDAEIKMNAIVEKSKEHGKEVSRKKTNNLIIVHLVKTGK